MSSSHNQQTKAKMIKHIQNPSQLHYMHHNY